MPSVCKKNLILTGVLLSLGALALILEGPWSLKKAPESSPPAVYGGSREAVDHLELTGPDGTVTLKRERGVWMAGEKDVFFPADQEAVNRILDQLADLNGGLVIARNPASHGAYQVDDKGGIRVVISEKGRKTSDFIVGGQGPDLFSSYVRRQGDPEVVLVKGYLRPLVDRPLKRWRDLSLLSFPAGDAIGVVVTRPEARLTLRQEAGKWMSGDTSRVDVDAGAVGELLSRLASLKASDVAGDPPDDTGFGQPVLRIAVTLKGESVREATVGRMLPDKSQYYARAAGKEPVLLVSAFTVREIGRLADGLANPKRTSGNSLP